MRMPVISALPNLIRLPYAYIAHLGLLRKLPPPPSTVRFSLQLSNFLYLSGLSQRQVRQLGLFPFLGVVSQPF